MTGNQRGATLVELLVGVAVMAIVAGMGVGSLMDLLVKSRGRVAAVEIAGELRAARHEALMRGERIRAVFDQTRGRMQIEQAAAPRRVIHAYNFADRGVVVERLSNGPAVEFFPSGRTATPTTIILRVSETERWQLTVGLTGKVTVQ